MKGWKITSEVLLVLLIISIGIIVSQNLSLSLSEKSNDIFLSLIKADGGIADASVPIQKGDQFYDLASLSNVEYNCKQARDYFLEGTQKLRATKSELKNHDEQIFVIYREMINTHINIYNNLYEACEYFESASRQYAGGDWANGDESIILMNEKIMAHDSGVNRYNDLIEDYSRELDKLIS